MNVPAVCGAGLLAFGLATPMAHAGQDWPPGDPGEGTATVAFTVVWAARHRDFHSFHDLQQAVGAGGKITAFETQSETPRVVYHWAGFADQGRMDVFAYEDGGFGAIIHPAAGGGEILFNTFGAFVCPTCSPPVNACGRRPSWVPHSLHWDVFDCAQTLTGPQSLYPNDR